MAKIADVTFTGQSGREYQFGVYPRDTAFKDVGGVYVFSKGFPMRVLASILSSSSLR